MQHILQDVLGDMNEEVLSAMAAKAGLNVTQTRSAMGEVVPAIFGGLAKNTKKKAGLSALFNALKKDHDGSVLDQMGEVVEDPERFKASKILGHIFGSKQDALTDMIGKDLGADKGAVGGLMAMAAPMIMGQLGKSLQKYGLSEYDLKKLLAIARSDSKKEGKAQAIVIAFLDKDGDGDVKDDLMSMAGRWIQKKFRG